MTDIPRGSLARTAKLVGLPLGHAGRAALGVGKRVGGRPAEAVAAELQARTAEQLFAVLGQLKGGAMKFGQALSVMEAAMPEELAGPYRATLSRLQESGPPMGADRVHEILEFDPSWLSVYLELVRRARTDPAFRERLDRRETEFVMANRARVEEAQRAGEIRDDLDPKSLGIFVNLVLHGLMLQRATGEDPPPVDLVLGLLEDAIGGPARTGTRPRTPA